MITLNIRPICCGAIAVPSHIPSDENAMRAEHADEQHFAGVRSVSAGIGPMIEARDRQHERRGDHSLNHSRDDLLRGDRARVGHRREQAILDLLRPSEILHHRQRDGLNRRELRLTARMPGSSAV